jgi:hypothetical protein
MDNRKGKCCGCPAQMADGNFITDYKSSRNVTNKQIKKQNRITDHNMYRNYLQVNCEQILAKEANNLEKNRRCSFNRTPVKIPNKIIKKSPKVSKVSKPTKSTKSTKSTTSKVSKPTKSTKSTTSKVSKPTKSTKSTTSKVSKPTKSTSKVRKPTKSTTSKVSKVTSKSVSKPITITISTSKSSK